MRFQVLSHRSVSGSQCFKGYCHFHLQGQAVIWLLAQWHSIICQKTLFSNTAARPSNLKTNTQQYI